MDYMEAMAALEQEGFLWHRLREYFPFGATALREGDYQRLLMACLDRLPDETDRERLLDLLDMHAAAFLEQCWVQDVLGAAGNVCASADTTGELGRFGMAAHFAAAWLQINSKFRGNHRRGGFSMMQVLSSLPSDGSLAQFVTGRLVDSTEAN